MELGKCLIACIGIHKIRRVDYMYRLSTEADCLHLAALSVEFVATRSPLTSTFATVLEFCIPLR